MSLQRLAREPLGGLASARRSVATGAERWVICSGSVRIRDPREGSTDRRARRSARARRTRNRPRAHRRRTSSWSSRASRAAPPRTRAPVLDVPAHDHGVLVVRIDLRHEHGDGSLIEELQAGGAQRRRARQHRRARASSALGIGRGCAADAPHSQAPRAAVASTAARNDLAGEIEIRRAFLDDEQACRCARRTRAAARASNGETLSGNSNSRRDLLRAASARPPAPRAGSCVQTRRS